MKVESRVIVNNYVTVNIYHSFVLTARHVSGANFIEIHLWGFISLEI